MNLSLDIYVFLLKFEKRQSYLADLAGDNTAYSPLLFFNKIILNHWAPSLGALSISVFNILSKHQLSADNLNHH